MWFVVTVIINKTVVAGNTTDTLLLTAVACVTVVCLETLVGSYIPPELPLSGNFSASDAAS